MANREVPIFGAILMSIAAISAIGCGKSDPPAAATQPAAAMHATTIAAPSPAVLDIGGEPIEFGVTALTVSADADTLHLQLSGADRSAKPESTFYFTLTLDGDDPATLPGKIWRMAATEDNDVDGSAGIFLNDNAIQLQPKQVTVEFAGDYPNLSVTVTGTFLRDGDEAKPVKVRGTFAVKAIERPSR